MNVKVVVDTHHRVVGMVTRKDLVRCHRCTHTRTHIVFVATRSRTQ